MRKNLNCGRQKEA